MASRADTAGSFGAHVELNSHPGEVTNSEAMAATALGEMESAAGR